MRGGNHGLYLHIPFIAQVPGSLCDLGHLERRYASWPPPFLDGAGRTIRQKHSLREVTSAGSKATDRQSVLIPQCSVPGKSESKTTTHVPGWIQDWVIRLDSPEFGVAE